MGCACGGGGLEDTLESPEPGGAQAAPSRLPCAPSLLGAKFGAARGARHPGSGVPGGVRTSARSASLGSACRARGGVCPVPRPTEAVHTSAPRPERGGPGGSARPRPSAAQRRGGRASSPLRSAPGRGRGVMLPGGVRPAEPPTCGTGVSREGVSRGL